MKTNIESERYSYLRSTTRFLLTLIVFGAIATTAWSLNKKFDLTSSMFTPVFAISTALAIFYRLVNPVGWALVLRGFGHNVNAKSAIIVWLHAESRRWLPGGVWGYASRAVSSKELGVSVPVASASMLVELLITIIAAAIVSLIGIVLYWRKLAATVEGFISQSGLHWTHLAGGVTAAIAVSVVGYVCRKILQRKLLGLAEKAKALGQVQLQPWMLLTSLGYFVGMACLNGLVNQTLAFSIEGAVGVPVIAMIAATATAWIIGFLAFFSPGGILVREAALAALLLPWIPYEIGFSLAILSRFAQMIAEAAGMLAVMIPVRGLAKPSVSQVF